MNEYEEPQYFERYALDFETRKSQLLSSMAEVAAKDGEEIEVEAAMHRAFLSVYESSPALQEMVDSFVRIRTDMTPTQHRYMLRSVMQLVAIRQRAVDYPRGFEQDGAWHGVIQSILSDAVLKAELVENLHYLHLKTNIPSRYKSVPLLVHWMRANGRIGNEVSMIDLGCSRNLGLKALGFIENSALLNYTFDQTDVVEPVDHPDITRSKHKRVVKKWSKVTSQLQNTPFGLTWGVGRDLEDPDDPRIHEWTMACLTPRDYQIGRAAELELLDMAYTFNGPGVHPQISFEQRDIVVDAQLGNQKNEKPQDAGQFDIGTFVISLNQLSEVQREMALRRALRLIKPMGVLAIVEFARVPEACPNEIELLDDQWNKRFSCCTIILDKMNPHAYQEVMRWNGGRPRELNIPSQNGSEPEIMPAEGYQGVGLRSYIGQLALRM